jgi:hypothetical protein
MGKLTDIVERLRKGGRDEAYEKCGQLDKLEQATFGPGTCKRCRLIKPLAMLAVPGMHEDPETGELEGGTIHLDPLDEQRTGYCYECALIVAEEWKRKDA